MATIVKSAEDSSYSLSTLAYNTENYEKHTLKYEKPEYEEERNDCFDSCIKNEPINEDYEKTEYNFKIFEVEESQYNDTHNHRMIDYSDADRQNYYYNSSYKAANSDEEEADNESIMRRASLGKLKKNDIIDFYKEFQFKLECTICNTLESTFASLCVHYKNQHNMRGFAMCCGVKFGRRHLLIDHLCVHKDPNFFKCNKCHRVYQARDNLNFHLRKNRCTPKYECDQCGKQFLIQKNLMRHKLTHLKPIDKIFNCEKCHTSFESVEFLREHEKHIHAGVCKITCYDCGEMFSQKCSLQRHKRQHCPVKKVISFNALNNMEVEEVNVITPDIVLGGDEDITPIVKSEPPDDAETLQNESIVSKQFNTLKFKRKFNIQAEHRDSSEVEDDDNSNEEEEKEASVCKTFRNMYTPSVSDEFFREMQYIMECNLCNIILPDFQSLITHYRIVHNSVGYGMCCGRKFYRRGVLADHLKLHKDPNLFKCQLCSKRFNARRGLEKHIEICAKKLKKYK